MRIFLFLLFSTSTWAAQTAKPMTAQVVKGATPQAVAPVPVATAAVSGAVPPSNPIVYPTGAAAPLTQEQQDEEKKKDDEKSQQMQQMLQGLGPMMQGMGGGGGSGGGGSSPTPRNRSGGGGSSGENYVSQGAMEKCPADGSVPAKVDAARKEAVTFRTGCAAAQRGDKQKIVINDYSCDGTPTMWIFDLGGHCIAKTAITYGRGNSGTSGSGQCAQPCSGAGENFTPPGFHLTGDHPKGNDSKYNSSNSMEMIGLEGQKSSGSTRGILIHQAANPGTPSSLGCSGVCYSCYSQVKALLGYGALVYNSFGGKPAAPDCDSQAGLSHNPASCQLDRSAPEINPNSYPQADVLQGSGGATDRPSSGR